MGATKYTVSDEVFKLTLAPRRKGTSGGNKRCRRRERDSSGEKKSTKRLLWTESSIRSDEYGKIVRRGNLCEVNVIG